MNSKLVSVIITTYGDPSPLGRAIRSVFEQTYSNIELIVVDDNGIGTVYGEATAKEIQGSGFESRIKYIRHDMNLNGAAARNTGIRVSSGDYVAFLDNDDFYLPDKIERSEAFLSARPNTSAVLDDVLYVRDGIIYGRHTPSKRNLSFEGLLLDEMGLGSGSNLFLKKATVVDLGGFDETYTRHQDLEFMLRFLLRFNASSTYTLGIVKTTDGTCNKPRYKKMCEVKEKLLNDFSSDIDKVNPHFKSYLIKKTMKSLMLMALAENRNSDARKIARRMCLTQPEYHRVRLINWMRTSMYRVIGIRRACDLVRGLKVVMTLKKEDYRFIQSRI